VEDEDPWLPRRLELPPAMVTAGEAELGEGDAAPMPGGTMKCVVGEGETAGPLGLAPGSSGDRQRDVREALPRGLAQQRPHVVPCLPRQMPRVVEGPVRVRPRDERPHRRRVAAGQGAR